MTAIGRRGEKVALFFLVLATAAGCDGGASPSAVVPWTGPRQGTLVYTGNPTDLAIEGPGFLMVGSPDDPWFVRGGSFHIEGDGRMADPLGRGLVGYSGLANDPSGRLDFSTLSFGEGATVCPVTDHVDFAGQLDRAATPTSFRAAAPASTSNVSTVIHVYDSHRNLRYLWVFLSHAGDGVWTWHALAEDDASSGAGGELRFDESGALTGQNSFRAAWDFPSGDPHQEIVFNFSALSCQERGPSKEISGSVASTLTVQDPPSRQYVRVLPNGVVDVVNRGEGLFLAYVPIFAFADNAALSGDAATGFRVTAASGPFSEGGWGAVDATISSEFLERL